MNPCLDLSNILSLVVSNRLLLVWVPWLENYLPLEKLRPSPEPTCSTFQLLLELHLVDPWEDPTSPWVDPETNTAPHSGLEEGCRSLHDLLLQN
jgi:hypothetical protein